MFPRLYADVPNALLRGAIELKRAELILRALNTAVQHQSCQVDLHAHRRSRRGRARRANRAESARPTAAYLAECQAELEKQSPHAGAKNGNPTNITPTSGKRKYESSDTLHATAGVGTAKVPPVHVGTATPAVQAPQNCRAAAQLHPSQHPQQQPKSSPASPRQVGKPKLQGSESPQPTAQAFLGIELIREAIVSTLLLKTIPEVYVAHFRR